METSTRYLGNCQLCEGDFKVDVVSGRMEMRQQPDGSWVETPVDVRMVHHGFKRPGVGHIIGDCAGVGEKPYEFSCDLIKAHKAAVQDNLRHLKIRLAEFDAGTVNEFIHSEWDSVKGTLRSARYKCGETADFDFRKAYERQQRSLLSEIKMSEAEIDRCARRIASWKLRPIRTTEELVEKARAARGVREAEAQKRRDEKAKKRAEIDAKNAAFEARKRAVREAFADKIRELAKNPDESARRKAIDLIYEMRRPKYGRAVEYLSDLDSGDAFVALGLAKRADNGRIYYDY